MWEVEVLGSDDDLKMLTESFESGDTSVVGLAGRFFLRSASFEKMETAEKVRERAVELATSISGLARLTLKSPEPLRIGAVYDRREDGTRGITIFPRTVAYNLLAGVTMIGLFVLTLLAGWLEPPRMIPRSHASRSTSSSPWARQMAC